MAAVTFDTSKFTKTLRASGLSEAQETQLVTRLDLQQELEPIKKELIVLKWMIGLVFAVQAVPFLKIVFG